jgi:hypothetical protein
MQLKDIKYYYSLKNYLKDGDNEYIKKYTTVGFIKSKFMWEKYSHNSHVDFFDDFLKDYPEGYLKTNCHNCYEEITKRNKVITEDILFDILIRRLVLDCFIGFKAEETVKEALHRHGIETENQTILPSNLANRIDMGYNIDIVTFKTDKISHLIQIKNQSTFGYDGVYIRKRRQEFKSKEATVNQLLNTNLPITYYIYDKMSYVNKGHFEFYVNPNTDKLSFNLDELIYPNGSLKIRLHKTRPIA